MYSNYFFVKNTTFLARQYNWSNMFNTIITCRLSHYFRLKTCSSFLSHSHVFHLMFVINYVTVLSGKYPANFTRIPDSTGCLHFTRIPDSAIRIRHIPKPYLVISSCLAVNKAEKNWLLWHKRTAWRQPQTTGFCWQPFHAKN